MDEQEWFPNVFILLSYFSLGKVFGALKAFKITKHRPEFHPVYFIIVYDCWVHHDSTRSRFVFDGCPSANELSTYAFFGQYVISTTFSDLYWITRARIVQQESVPCCG